MNNYKTISDDKKMEDIQFTPEQIQDVKRLSALFPHNPRGIVGMFYSEKKQDELEARKTQEHNKIVDILNEKFGERWKDEYELYWDTTAYGRCEPCWLLSDINPIEIHGDGVLVSRQEVDI